MSKFRILSIFLAVGLLVGALGVGPVLAGQIDVTGLDTRDASYAPAQETVDLDDGEVQWTDMDGVGIKYTKADTAAVFYINDNALETVSKVQIATWTANAPSPMATVNSGFNVLTGEAARTQDDHDPFATSSSNADIPALFGEDGDGNYNGEFTLTGPADDVEDEDEDGMEVGTGNDLTEADYRDNQGFATSTFRGVNNSDDPNPIHEVKSVKVHFGSPAATTTITSRHIVESENDLVAILGGVDTGEYAEVRFTHHKRDIHKKRAHVSSTSDPDGEYVTIYEVTKVGEGMNATSSTSQVFRGELMLESEPEFQGTDEDGVWVQDGDTVTITYLDDEDETVDTDTLTVDSVAPEISDVAPEDGTVTSTTNPTVEFTATDTGSTIPLKGVEEAVTIRFGLTTDDEGVPLDVKPEDGIVDMGGTEISSDELSILGTGTGFRVIYTTTDEWDDVEELDGLFKEVDGNLVFVIGMWAEDSAGNMASAATTVTIDTTAPKVTGADTGIAWNSAKAEEKEGVVNAVRLTMSEAIDPDSVEGSDFEIDGDEAADAVVGTKKSAKYIYLTTEEDLDPAAKPKVEIVDEVTDNAGKEVALEKAGSSVSAAKDGLAPTVVSVTRDVQLLVAEDEVTITVDVDEKLKSKGATMSIQGPNGSDANTKAFNPGSEEALVYSTTQEISERGAKTGIYGIAVEVQDTNTNPGTNLVKVEDKKATIVVNADHAVITLSEGPVADEDFSGGVDFDDIMMLKVNNSTSTQLLELGDITVDASARTITLVDRGHGESGGYDDPEIEGNKLPTVAVTYHVVDADHTFEIDIDAPGVAVEANSTELDEDSKRNVADQAPFINVQFNDKEYPGDSYTDVTLTSAMLTMGDDEEATNIVDDFAVEANGHNWLYAAPNLELGEYTLEVTGEDTAGNEASATVTFTIIEKPATKIALSPGVNLISLPGNPATTSLEGVITNPNVSSVLTYDPSTPTKWLAAEKAPDGSWVGNLTEITGSLGYWVTTSNFDPLEVGIVSFSAGGADLPPTHNLVPGWNLIAVTVLDEEDEQVDANFYLGNNWLRAITYDASTRRFVTLGPDDLVDADDDGEEDDAPVLEVGKGYFVWMTKPHTVVP